MSCYRYEPKRHARDIPDSKIHGVNMGPIWVLLAPDGPHVGPMNLAVMDITVEYRQLCNIMKTFVYCLGLFVVNIFIMLMYTSITQW